MNEKYIKFSLYLIVILLINIVSLDYFFKLDLTKTKMYSLSPKSIKVISQLQEPLTIKCFFSKDLPPPYNTIKRYLKDILQEYSEYSNNYFNYEFLNADKPDAAKLANDYGIRPIQVQVIQKDELKYKSVYMGLVLLHGDAIEKIPVITTTNRLEYLLTTSIEKLITKVSYLLGLKGQINVDFYFSQDLKKIAPYINLKELNTIDQKIKELIDELNKKYYDKLKLNLIDLNINTNNIEKLSDEGIQVLKWPENKKLNLKEGAGGIGLILRYGNEKIPIIVLRVINIPIIGTQYLLASVDDLKDSIETGIQSLLHLNQTIGYLTDHDTLPLYSSPFGQSSSANNFRELLSEGYEIKEISLDKDIPSTLKSLIIAGPKEEFSDYELYQIDQALMRGTNLIIFLDKYSELKNNPSMLTINKTNLEKLLKFYGIEIEDGIVMDKNCFKQRMDRQQGGGEVLVYFAPIIKQKNINNSLRYMQNIKGLVMLKNSPLNITENAKKNTKVKDTLLFTSSKESWIEKNLFNLNPLFIKPPSDQKLKKYPLSYILEGEFESYFKDKQIPIKQDKDKDKNSAEKMKKQNTLKDLEAKTTKLDSGHGKIFIIGSSDIITDAVIDEQGDSPNSIFIMNIVDVLNEKMDRAILRSKIQEFNPLYELHDNTKMFIKIFNIVGLPIIVIITGFIIIAYRKTKKVKIQKMFS